MSTAFQIGAFQGDAFQGAAVVEVDFGGHFGLDRRRRRLPRNTREEIRELLDEVLGSPAAPEIERVLDEAVAMDVEDWSDPPAAALDALMGRAVLLQRIIRMQWQAELVAAQEKEEEEHMLLLAII